MNRLRELRKTAKITIEDLAEKSGISKSAIQRWEVGQAEPSFRSYAYKLAEMFSCTQAFLTGDEDAYIEVYVGTNMDATCLNHDQWQRISPFIKPVYLKRNDTIVLKTKKRQVSLNPSMFVWNINDDDFKAVYGDGMNKQELYRIIEDMDNSQIADMVDFARRYIIKRNQ